MTQTEIKASQNKIDAYSRDHQITELDRNCSQILNRK